MTPWQKQFWTRAEAAAERYLAELRRLHDDYMLSPDLEEIEDTATDAVRRALIRARTAAIAKRETAI